MEINFFPINIGFEEFQISRTKYSDKTLKELRNKYNKSHSFFRDDDYIYISNNSDENIELGETVTLKINSSEKVTSSLIKHIFFRVFKDRFPDIKPTSFYPFKFFSRVNSDDLVFPYLPDIMKNALSYRKQIDIQLRMFHINQQQQYGFIINTSYHWGLSKKCADLYTEGFDLIGLEVLKIEEMPESKDVLAANEEFIGEIKELQNDNALVSTNEGDILVPLNELTLRKTTYNIKSYLTHSLGESQSEAIISKVKFDEQNRHNNKNERTEINRIAQLISLFQDKTPVTYKNSDGFYYTVNSTPLNSENSFTLKKPPFIFDHAATKVENRNADAGLNNFGPWDAITFDCKSPHIVGICAKRNRGSFTEFLAKLINGDPNSQWFKKGIQKKYDLNNVTYEVFDIPNCDFTSYDNVISQLNAKPDLVIMEIPESFKKMKIEENPYYRLKAKLLTLEIPFQFIVESKVRDSNDALLNTIGLQIYAKLGGTPWVLPSTRSVDRELIIGVGNSIIRNNSFKGSEKNRVVGITTFFSSDGQYLLSNKAKDVSYSEYFNELLKTLKEAFTHLQELQGWKDNDTIRLIFHIFKPIKNIEFEVICKLMESFPRFKIQFAFVTISKKHPYKLYETSQFGVMKGNKRLGEYTPLRGTNIILDSTSCLVQMLGANEIKTDRHGASSPILIKIRTPQGNFDSSTLNDILFTDIQYISQQIFSFTYLSWRSFLPKELPATMLYSDLIANLLGRLRKINGWQPDILNFKLKQKKWFL